MEPNTKDLNEPLIQPTNDDLSDEEFHDAVESSSASISSVLHQPNTPPAKTNQTPTKEAMSPGTSFYGKASQLSTGMLFGPSPRGVVDSIPDPSKPCLLFNDSCPISECAYITLLEKEFESFPTDDSNEELPTNPQLFTVIHVCEALAKHDDSGSRLLKKIRGKAFSNGSLEIPVLLHEGNILREKRLGSNNNNYEVGGSLLLPEYIDAAIGTKNSLRPNDSVTLYNMNLFIQRHSQLSGLFFQLLTSQYSNERLKLSKELLNFLKSVDDDLQTFTGPYLCGEQFTLADICLYPIMERIAVVLPSYRDFWIPPSLSHLLCWYEAASVRPSVRVATADRSDESMKTYCFERRNRREYLIEVYECHSRNEDRVFRDLNDTRGSAGYNIYREYVDEELRDRRICEAKSCQKCVIS
mmetsp:Transcript_11304/g.23830  ORF Transcript_11304/g.23830 Transcript_11304/m.23830 type:complete len:412 (+) Transcript_11304:59-1294(+)